MKTNVYLGLLSFAGTTSAFSSGLHQLVPSKIAVGSHHTCVLFDGGQVKCWGENADGELGSGSKEDHGRTPASMGRLLASVNLGTGTIAKDICNGAAFSCVVTNFDQVKCWGKNAFGELGQEHERSIGIDPSDMGDNLLVTPLGSQFKAVEVQCGLHFACALDSLGLVKCWGRNSKGQLGLDPAVTKSIGSKSGEMGEHLSPLSLPMRATHLAAGGEHACAASKESVFCWGNNDSGQVGIESPRKSIFLKPDLGTLESVKLEDKGQLPKVLNLTTGYSHSCAVYRMVVDGKELPQKTKCWGANFRGELGIGIKVDRIGVTPSSLGSKLPDVQLRNGETSQIEAYDNYTCAVGTNTTLKCWGSNYDGNLGLGDAVARGSKSTDMGEYLPFVALGLPILGLSHGGSAESTCAILINHEIKCWGYGYHGALGYEDAESRGHRLDDMGEKLPFVRFR